MTQNYTLNDLVRLLYRETSKLETKELREEMACDYELQEEYNILRQAARKLPKVTFSPSNKCLEEILNYSRRTAVLAC